MTRVLIIGANGFLGRNLTAKCLDRQWLVDVVIHKSKENIDNRVSNIYTHNQLMNAEIPAHYTYVFNIAAFIPYGKYNTPDEQLITSNIALPLKLLQLFRDTKIIFASSVSVYGNNAGLITERSEKIDPTLYGLSKLSGELITAHHNNYAILRFSSLYGQGMYGGTFIPYVVADAKAKGAIRLLGEGLRLQNYIHISDAAEYCIHAALHGDNDIYLGVYTRSYQNREVAEIISHLTGCSIEYSGIDNSPSYEYVSDYATEKLQFTPLIPLEVGLKDLIHA